MQTLTLIRGLPGSGKSTLAKAMAQATGARHHEADMWMLDATGLYRFDPGKLSEVHTACYRATDSAVTAGYDVIVSNTFTTRKEAKPYIDLASEFQIRLNVIECTGEFGSIHGVPQATFDKMRARWENF